MKILLKFVAWTAGVVVALVVVAAVALPVFVDPNDFKGQIADLVKEHTGRALTIEGDIELSVFPWLGAKVGPVALGNPAGFEGDVFASAERSEVRVKLVPLLSKQVEMDTATVHGLKLNLVTNAAGENNWDGLVAAERKPGEPPALAALAIGGVEALEAAITWNDHASGKHYRVDGINLKTGAIVPPEPVEVKLGFDFSLEDPKVAGSVKVSGSVALDQAAQRLQLSALKMEVALREAPGLQRETQVTIAGDAAFDQTKNLLSTGDIELAIAGLELEGLTGGLTASGRVSADVKVRTLDLQGFRLAGKLSGTAVPGGSLEFQLGANVQGNHPANALVVSDLTGALKGPFGDFDLSSEAASGVASGQAELTGLRLTGKLTDASLPGGALDVDLRTGLGLDLAGETVSLSNLSVRALDLQVDGDLVLRDFLSKPRLLGPVTVAAFDARRLLPRLEIEVPRTTDQTALTSVELATTVSGWVDDIQAQGLALRVDDTFIRGDLKVTGLTDKPAYRFDLDVGNVDANRYLPPDGGRSRPAATPGAAAAGAAGALPGWLKALDAQGSLRAASVRYGDLRLRNLKLRVTGKDGRVTADPISARVRGGTYSGHLKLDARGKKPRVSFNEKLTGVDIDGLLKDLQLRTVADGLPGTAGDLALAGHATLDTGRDAYSVKGLRLRTQLKGKSLPAGRLDLAAQGDVDLNWRAGSASVKGLGLDFAGAQVRGDVKVSGFNKRPSFSGTVQVAPFNPRRVLAALGETPPVTADGTALTKAALSTGFNGTQERISLQGLKLQLDGAHVDGNLEVANLSAPSPAVRFDLVADRLNLDAYLPPEGKGKPRAPVTPGGAAAGAATGLPVEDLRAVDVDGHLKAARLQLTGLQATGVELRVRGKDGIIRFNPVTASLYGGFYTSVGAIDATGQKPRVTIDTQLSEVDVGALLRAVQGDAPVTGKGNLRAKVAATGMDGDQMLRTLNGDVDFMLQNGILRDVDMASTICAFGGGGKQTRFTTLGGKVRIENGRAYSESLNMASNVVNVQGRGGYVDLPSERLNLGLAATLGQGCAGGLQTIGAVARLTGLKIRELERADCLIGHPIAFQVTGTVDRPNFDDLRQKSWNALRTFKSCTRGEIPAQAGGQPQQQQPAQQGDLKDQILQKGLESIFGR